MNSNYNDVNILLIEDDDIDAKAVVRGLHKLKLANPVIRAKNGLDALAILREKNKINRPYIILLDLNMPIMGGLSFLQEIRRDEALNSSIVFVLTTSDTDEDRVAAYSEHVAGYIVKSNIEDGFDNVLKMLNTYWKVVVLPTE